MVLFPLPNCKKIYRIPSPASESNFNTKGPWSLVILLCLKTTYHCDFLFITLAMHPLYIYIYIYIYQTTASISGKFSNGQQFRISPVVYPTNCCCSCCCSCCSCFKISSQAVVGYLNYPLEWTAEKLPFRMTIPDPIDPRTQSP